jgi:hypothetical protein
MEILVELQDMERLQRAMEPVDQKILLSVRVGTFIERRREKGMPRVVSQNEAEVVVECNKIIAKTKSDWEGLHLPIGGLCHFHFQDQGNSH